MYQGEVEFKALFQKTVTEIINDDSSHLTFKCSDGSVFEMYHTQDCCENVYLEDIAGDLDDLLNSPITMAEEESNSDQIEGLECSDSFTWTFYKLATIKGYVTLRWLGESNGYYSEAVSFYKTA